MKKKKAENENIEVASGAEYRMGEQLQNLPIFFIVPNCKILEIY